MSVRTSISKLFSRLSCKQNTGRTRRNFKRWLQMERMEERRVLATIDLAALTASEGMTVYGGQAMIIVACLLAMREISTATDSMTFSLERGLQTRAASIGVRPI